MKQRGAAKLRALEFQPEELVYTPAEEVDDPDHDGEKLTLSPAIYDAGIQKILDAWDSMVGRTVSDRKGELRERYYMNMKRGPVESVVNFALRYRNLVAEMKADNITLDDAEVAWFFKQKLNLTEMQKQMLETTLSGMTEAYADVERIHGVGNPLAHTSSIPRKPFGGLQRQGHRLQQWRRGSTTSSLASGSTSTSTSSSWSRGSRMPLGAFAVNVTEQEFEDEHGMEPSEDHEVQEVTPE